MFENEIKQCVKTTELIAVKTRESLFESTFIDCFSFLNIYIYIYILYIYICAPPLPLRHQDGVLVCPRCIFGPCVGRRPGPEPRVRGFNMSIPVLDFSRSESAEGDSLRGLSTELHAAFTQVGLVLLQNTGISQQEVRRPVTCRVQLGDSAPHRLNLLYVPAGGPRPGLRQQVLSAAG